MSGNPSICVPAIFSLTCPLATLVSSSIQVIWVELAAGRSPHGNSQGSRERQSSVSFARLPTHPSFPGDPGLGLGVSCSTHVEWGLWPPQEGHGPSQQTDRAPHAPRIRRPMRKGAPQPGTGRPTRAGFARPEGGWRRYRGPEPPQASLPPCRQHCLGFSSLPFIYEHLKCWRRGGPSSLLSRQTEGKYLAGASTKGKS